MNGSGYMEIREKKFLPEGVESFKMVVTEKHITVFIKAGDYIRTVALNVNRLPINEYLRNLDGELLAAFKWGQWASTTNVYEIASFARGLIYETSDRGNMNFRSSLIVPLADETVRLEIRDHKGRSSRVMTVIAWRDSDEVSVESLASDWDSVENIARAHTFWHGVIVQNNGILPSKFLDTLNLVMEHARDARRMFEERK